MDLIPKLSKIKPSKMKPGKLAALRLIEMICANNMDMGKSKRNKLMNDIYAIAHGYSGCGPNCPVRKEGKAIVQKWVKEGAR